MDIYREEILEHYKNPTHAGRLSNPTKTIHESNPLCGDEVDLDILLEGDIVKEVKFDGKGCAISIAATDILIDMVIGKSVDGIKNMKSDQILNAVNPQLTLSRIKCATLGFNSLKKLL